MSVRTAANTATVISGDAGIRYTYGTINNQSNYFSQAGSATDATWNLDSL